MRKSAYLVDSCAGQVEAHDAAEYTAQPVLELLLGFGQLQARRRARVLRLALLHLSRELAPLALGLEELLGLLGLARARLARGRRRLRGYAAARRGCLAARLGHQL